MVTTRDKRMVKYSEAALPTMKRIIPNIKTARPALLGVILISEKWLPEIKALRDYYLLGVLFLAIIILGIGISFFSTHRSVIKYLKMKLDDLY